MNRLLMRYYLRRLGCLKLTDITQRLRLRRFHNHHYRCLEKAQNRLSPEVFFPGEEGAFRQLMTAAGVRSAGPYVVAGWIGDDAFWDEFVSAYPRAADQIISQAEAIRSNRITLFGWKEVQLSTPICWSDALDPVHPDLKWPSDHYAVINFFRHPQFGRIDVKWVWELNRFQHLLYLGAAWRITRNEVYAQTAQEHIRSWIEQVQYPLGVQWSSNLEVALRMLSWARCHLMCASSASWDDEFLMRFIPCLYTHVSHVEQELTVHHTPGNHLLGEACSLIQVCSIFKGFPRVRQRLERAKKIVETLVPKLLLSDGVYSEQSTAYLKFVLEFLVSGIPFMDDMGAALSEQVWARVAAAANYICCVAPDLRNMPMIGDCDSGSAVGWRLSDFWDYEPLVMALCSFLHKSVPLKLAKKFPAESFLLVGSRGREPYEALKKGHSIRTTGKSEGQIFHEFPEGGYQVSTDSRLHVILDGGPLGISPGYGHGHLDALSFVLSLDGHPFLVDPGTMLYNGLTFWRDYFRGGSAHNTVRLDQCDPSRPIAAFLWSEPLNVRLENSACGEGWRLLQARQKTGVVHTRSIIHWYERGIVVGDTIQGRGVHVIEWFLHFHPDWVVAQEDTGVITAHGYKTIMSIQFHGYDRADCRSYVGSLEPISGWYSCAYGKLQPCTSLRLRLRARLPISTLFVVRFPDYILRIPPEIAEYFSGWEGTPL